MLAVPITTAIAALTVVAGRDPSIGPDAPAPTDAEPVDDTPNDLPAPRTRAEARARRTRLGAG